MDDLLAVIQNYDDHKNIYEPEVIDSKLITRRDNDFQIYLRLKKNSSASPAWFESVVLVTMAKKPQHQDI